MMIGSMVIVLADGLTAYRKHNSCETSLIGLVEDWKFARDNRLFSGNIIYGYVQSVR